MTDKQREAHEALVNEIAYEIMKAPHKFIEYSIWEMHCARRIAALIAGRLSDVTEDQLDAALSPTSSWRDIKGSQLTVNREKMRLRLFAWLRASALFPGDEK